MVFLTGTSCVERSVYTGDDLIEFREVIRTSLQSAYDSSYIFVRRWGPAGNLAFYERLYVEQNGKQEIFYVIRSGSQEHRSYYYSNGILYAENRVLGSKYQRDAVVSELDFLHRLDAGIRSMLELLNDNYIYDMKATSETWNNQPATIVGVEYIIDIAQVRKSSLFSVDYDSITLNFTIHKESRTTNGFSATFVIDGVYTGYHFTVVRHPDSLRERGIFPTDSELEGFVWTTE